METKICTKCKLDKSIDKYHNKKTGKDGLSSICKECISNNTKTFYSLNKQQILQNKKDYYNNNKEQILHDAKDYYLLNKEKIYEYKKEYFQQNKEKIYEYKKEYLIDNKEKLDEYYKKYKLDNKDKQDEYLKQYRLDINNNIKHKEYMKIYFQENKEKIYEYYTNKKNKDPLFKLSCNIRTLIYMAFKNKSIKKNTKTADILGCTFDEFKIHIEEQFDDKMNWDNHATYWQYDHIKPISLANTEQEVYELNHYTNFQPLEKTENRLKSNKYGF